LVVCAVAPDRYWGRDGDVGEALLELVEESVEPPRGVFEVGGLLDGFGEVRAGDCARGQPDQQAKEVLHVFSCLPHQVLDVAKVLTEYHPVQILMRVIAPLRHSTHALRLTTSTYTTCIVYSLRHAYSE